MHTNPTRTRLFRYFLIVALLASGFGHQWQALAQRKTGPKVSGVRRPSGRATKPSRSQPQLGDPRGPRGATTGERIITDAPIQRSTADLMIDQAARGEYVTVRQQMWEKGLLREEKEEGLERDDLPSAPGSRPGTEYPALSKSERQRLALAPEVAPQTLSTTFDGATGPTETGAFPPDTMGAVGPTQMVVFLNGRLRTFNKTTGVADGVINADSDVFFASVVSTPGAGEVAFTSDPNVRFDRLSNRWFLSIIDVVLNSTTGATTRVNRILLAVSDAASNGTISGTTVWSFYQFTGDATLFTDYPGFGIDASAIYIGGDMFTLAGSFNSTKGWVIPKAPALTGGPLTVWAFSNLATGASAGPFAPRGVDNPDPTNTGVTATGYFIGPNVLSFSTLMLRRVTNPGSTGASPTISANISLTTPNTTNAVVKVPHLGNTGGNNGRLDALDDRLYAAVIRNGRLWTAHGIGVNNTGTTTGTRTRNAARWYELQNLGTTPTFRQSGTLYDNSGANDVNQRNYWIPSITVTGQGHVALACSIAGTNERVNAFFTGRLSGDTLGTMRDGPGGSALAGYTASGSAYNPPSDAGGAGGRRWGDYSFTSVDPKDDMTIWTIQEYVNGTNTYGLRVAKLLAPPPANIADGPGPGGVYQVLAGQASINVTIGGLAPAGQGFYDPGADPAAPHTPFNHIAATVSGASVVVNSVTYTSPTSITLNLNTTGATAGLRNLTITNPDGQAVTRNNVIQIMSPTAAPAPLSGRVIDSLGSGVGSVAINVRSTDGTVNQTVRSNGFGYFTIPSLDTGVSYVITPTRKQYTFDPPSTVYTHQGAFAELNFTGTRLTNRSRSRGR